MASMRARRSGLLLYFWLAFAISWAGIAWLARGTGMPVDPTRPDAARLRLLMFPAMLAGPTLASLLVTFALDGVAGVRRMLARFRARRIGGAALLFLAAPVAMVLVLGALSLWSPRFVPLVLTSDQPGTLVIMAMVGGLGAGVFEELGWTGFATPRLLARHGVFSTGVILGVPWAVWHGLSDYWGSAATFGPLWTAHMLQWVLALTAFRIVMTWLYARTHSLTFAALMHASFTGSQLLLWPQPMSPAGELLWYGCFAGVLWLMVAVLRFRERTERRADHAHLDLSRVT